MGNIKGYVYPNEEIAAKILKARLKKSAIKPTTKPALNPNLKMSADDGTGLKKISVPKRVARFLSNKIAKALPKRKDYTEWNENIREGNAYKNIGTRGKKVK